MAKKNIPLKGVGYIYMESLEKDTETGKYPGCFVLAVYKH
jgi:hypothetical protein